ncbi:MAG: galactokinase [Oscillochloridaceae bacterium]|nr:galactokinase [Chloroflexaceae bacterium]MDW8391931.1 galactokinase [Oscillochloridaceae bacterium]
MLDVRQLYNAFATHFGDPPALLVRAPGRVNLIGEHTDYNEGFVLPIAIDRATFVAARARTDRVIRVYSAQFDAEDQFSLDQVERNPDQPWSNYVRGVVKGMLACAPSLSGADLSIDSQVPLGAGLSSSAALEVAVAYALQLLNALDLSAMELALLAQEAERSFVGMQCGIMDQFMAALGSAGHALLLDCRDLSYRPIPIPPQARVVVCDSGVRHTLMGSEYNERRAACEQAVQLLRARLPQISALRDVAPAQLEANADLLPQPIIRRARHVVSEIERTLAAAAALERGDLGRFGALMDASHASLRDDYEVSTPELDALVELARRLPGCYGSRLTGGGFGGSTVSLVEEAAVEGFAAELVAGYRARLGREAHVLVCTPSEGVSQVAVF